MSTVRFAKRESILLAAKRIFLLHGYAGASMEAIAEAAPVAKATLYSHFEGKQDLFAAVISLQCEALLNTLAWAHTEVRDPVAALTAIARAFVDLIYSEDALTLYRVIIGEQLHFPELGGRVYRSGPEPVLRRLSAYLEDLSVQKVLAIPDVGVSARLFLGMLKGDEHFRCLLGQKEGLSEAEKISLVGAAVDLFLRGHGYAESLCAR
ncbi:transcriptional regulator, TetR family [Methylococcus capsulatus str. Bath]|jgi:TetR/AcrR family transcriptional repressor of mexJK operon|uniref:Transcriptional regulator, TetR family n=2 Tax=Methylococcus capsulatus TaxID=414 RepID=Q605M4_METCA|nr:TetR/AcrR family transcriptional regulator [Methylococcus capsulatus]AAU91749.1 transcriptional regulator, TetR family [Methylococcus capsulatus str. Bath]UQN12150.1 TetR/AcrR family transcriptional regulator [Methylococcus capsulatus]CAI8842770.1 TetR/AcrR family transcriptional regulator, mexJK operon transcriptional repressor [Methylococcus capsulatus]